MQRVKLGILAAVLLFAFCGQVSAQSSDKARVLSLENLWNEAQGNNDAKALAALLGPNFSYVDADGNLSDKGQFLADVRTAGPAQIVNDSMKAEAYGDVIIVTGTYKEQGVDNGKPYTRRGRFTDTWIQQNGQWLCAASQETLIAHP